MRCGLLVVVPLLALSGASFTSCSSPLSPKFPSVVFDELQTHNHAMNKTHAVYNPGLGVPRSRDGVRFLEVVVTSCVFIGALFLLLRCAVHILESERFARMSERRLAGDDPCGEKVSTKTPVCQMGQEVDHISVAQILFCVSVSETLFRICMRTCPRRVRVHSPLLIRAT